MNTIQTKDKTHWLARGKLSCMAAAAGLAFSAFQGFAQQVPSQPVKNIVLVHGAFADGSSWSKVIKILQAKGYNATAVQNPLTSFADDVAATRRVLALQNGPVILVGHSWAGVVITEAGVETNVVGLVYVAAFGPDVGETAEALGKSYPPPASFATAIVDKQGFMTLSTDAFVQHFAWDLPVADSKVLAATQGPINTSAFSATVSNVAWKTKPSWFIVAEKDQAISPDEERFFARRMNATTTELNTSHVPMLSKPKEVAAAIMDAAAKATTTKSSPKGAFTATQNLTAIRRGIEETTHRFEDAFNSGDAAGAARQFYTRDARVLPPGAEMVQGRDRIAEFWATAADAPQMGVRRAELSTLHLQALGDEAYEIGRATLTLADGQRATPKYVAVWKYEDGAWRRHVDIWNMDTP